MIPLNRGFLHPDLQLSLLGLNNPELLTSDEEPQAPLGAEEIPVYYFAAKEGPNAVTSIVDSSVNVFRAYLLDRVLASLGLGTPGGIPSILTHTSREVASTLRDIHHFIVDPNSPYNPRTSALMRYASWFLPIPTHLGNPFYKLRIREFGKYTSKAEHPTIRPRTVLDDVRSKSEELKNRALLRPGSAFSSLGIFTTTLQRPSAKLYEGWLRIVNSTPGRVLRGGLRSYLTTNWLLGKPLEETLGEHTASLAMHVLISGAIDYGLTRFMRTPGKAVHRYFFEHLSKLKPDAEGSVITAAQATRIKQQLKALTNYLSELSKKRLLNEGTYHTIQGTLDKIVSTLSFQGESLRIDTKDIQSKVTQLGKALDRLSANARNVIYNYFDDLLSTEMYSRPIGEKAVQSSINALNSKSVTTDFFGRLKQGQRQRGTIRTFFVTPVSALKEGFRKAVETYQQGGVIQAISSAGKVVVPSYLNTVVSLIGSSIRLANITSAIGLATGVMRSIMDYRNDLRSQFYRNALTMETAFSYNPIYDLSGSERQRAIEAMQRSSLNVRQLFGNEAQLLH